MRSHGHSTKIVIGDGPAEKLRRCGNEHIVPRCRDTSKNRSIARFVGGAAGQFFEELKRFPNVPYMPYGPGFTEMIPPQFK